MTLSPALRKLVLTIHLTTSVGWVGAVIAYLGLGIAAVESSDTERVRAAWTAMDVIGWWVILPLAIGALVTGLVMSLGTRWGLFRHYWTLISLALTVLCTAVLVLHMPSVSATARMVRTVEGSDLRALGGDLFHPGAGLLLLLAITVLNVYKPEGMTPYGWRTQRDERRMQRTSASVRPAAPISAQFRGTGRFPAASSLIQLATTVSHFTFHFAEMWFAMFAGMAAFIALRFALSAVGISGLGNSASIEFQVGMGLFMVAPMAAWMRFRGCGWRECFAMTAAMLLSTGAVLVSSAFKLHEAQLWLASNQHLLMLVGMLAFMVYRREQYTSAYSFGRWRGSSHVARALGPSLRRWARRTRSSTGSGGAVSAVCQRSRRTG